MRSVAVGDTLGRQAAGRTGARNQLRSSTHVGKNPPDTPNGIFDAAVAVTVGTIVEPYHHGVADSRPL